MYAPLPVAFDGNSENLHCLAGDLPVVRVPAPDGACATIALHGGHVLSWVPAGGCEMLYLSPRSGFASGQPIRGGVPVIFPQFSDRGPLMRHGFARVLPWQLLRQEEGADFATAVLRLVDSAQTRARWPFAFELDLLVRVGADHLSMELACRNTGGEDFRFQAALHSYFRVGDLGSCRLTGLDAHSYRDALDQADRTQVGAIDFGDGDLDRVYADVPSALVLERPAGPGSGRDLQIAQDGFDDVVVWNPGAGKCAALTDMPPDGWRHMVCVEAARIGRPVTLAPGAIWRGAQRLSAAIPAAGRVRQC